MCRSRPFPVGFDMHSKKRSARSPKCNLSVTETVLKIGGHIIKQNIPVHDVSQSRLYGACRRHCINHFFYVTVVSEILGPAKGIVSPL